MTEVTEKTKNGVYATLTDDGTLDTVVLARYLIQPPEKSVEFRYNYQNSPGFADYDEFVQWALDTSIETFIFANAVKPKGGQK